MSRDELVRRITQAIAAMEGFYRRAKEPTLAQRNANPGNVRTWKDARGRAYPRFRGYVDFVAWASEKFPGATRDELSSRALAEGWRVLRVLVSQYLDGKYTGGKTPTLYEMFRVYAPASDGNDPDRYARFVAARIGVPPDRALVASEDEKA